MNKMWKSVVAIGTSLCMCLGCLAGCGSQEEVKTIECPAETQGEADVLGKVSIPVHTKNPYLEAEEQEGEEAESLYEAWEDERMARIEAGKGLNGSLDSFHQVSIKEFLKDSQGNVAYSPVNLWMALAMLAESADGDSRQQILDLLKVENLEELQSLVENVWQATERDDGVSITLPANSLWMNRELAFHQDTVGRLADVYHASTFTGQMGSEAYNELLRQWLDEQTKGLLTNLVNTQGFNEDTLLALVSAIYFKDKWSETFSEGATSPEVFHGLNGDQEKDFLHGTRTCSYYEGYSFSALLLPFEGNRGMWVLLPKEGYTVDQVMEEEAGMKMLAGRFPEEETHTVEATLAMPKFDITSELDLVQGLKNLGVTDIFDGDKANFDGILSGEAIGRAGITDALQAARVKIDEEGCEAAAFTIFKCGAVLMPQTIEFTVDRPFLFSIVSDSDLPLFTGIVNQP